MGRRRRSLLSKLIVGISASILLIEAAVLIPTIAVLRRDLVDARKDALARVARVVVERRAPEIARDPAAGLASLARDLDLHRAELDGASVVVYDRDWRRIAEAGPDAAPEKAVDAALAAARPGEEAASIECGRRLFVVTPVPVAGAAGGREAAGYLAISAPLEAVTARLADHVLAALGVVLAILLFTGFGTIVLVWRHVLRPIAALRAANRALVEGDDANALAPESEIPEDELGDVIRSRNELVRRMLEYEAAIREKNEVLTRQGQELLRWAKELESRVHEKSRELQRAGERLLASEKLAAAGRLAAGIAHEINNPLASIAGYAEDLLGLAKDPALASLPEFAEFPESLAVIHEQAFRCKRIIRQLLSYARPAPFHLEPVDLASLVEDVLPLVEHKGRARGVEVSVTADMTAPAALADRGNLIQVLVNLLENAYDAIEGPRGKISIAVAPHGQRHVEIAISDTGRGIPEANRTKVFEPFFTTKPAGSGTGLGLSIVHALVSRLGGTIDLKSEVGRGTTFTIALPAAPALAAAGASTEPAAAAASP